MNNMGAAPSGSSRSLRGWIVFLAFIAIVAYLIANGHTLHVLTVLPFLIFLACPLMMLFMHHDMGGGPGSGSSTKS